MTRIAIVAVLTSILSVIPAYSGYNPQNLMDRAQGEIASLQDATTMVRNPMVRRDLEVKIDNLHATLEKMQAQGAYQGSSGFDRRAPAYNRRAPAYNRSAIGHDGGSTGFDRRPVRDNTPRRTPPPAQYGLSFQDAMSMVRDESFDQNKLRAVQRAARNGRFSTQQARSIADELTFDQNKADALIALYPSVTDPHRYSMSLSILDFPSSRNRVSTSLSL